jgi:hypothetical protein
MNFEICKKCKYNDNSNECSLLKHVYYELILKDLFGIKYDDNSIKEKYKCPYYVEITISEWNKKE